MDTKTLLDRVAGRDTGDKGKGIALGMDKYCPQYSINSPRCASPISSPKPVTKRAGSNG
jgi:hypothetical protein